MTKVSVTWKVEHAARDPQTEIELRVWCPNQQGWFWSAFDPVEDDSCVSVLPGFPTAEAAMQAAEQWYSNEWLPEFEATGNRAISK